MHPARATTARTRTHGRDGTAKEDGLGQEGTIPSEPGSVGVGAGEPTTFEPEEDPDAAARRDPDAPDGDDQPTR